MIASDYGRQAVSCCRFRAAAGVSWGRIACKSMLSLAVSRPSGNAGQQQKSAGNEIVHAAAERWAWPPADAEQQQASIETDQLPVQVLLMTSRVCVGQGR